ncbi:hypothetical protein KUTeg_023423 [Tegillarca granosa]|uniref:Uncharacterized protein n=1 Tax=Tegillarca granosa TaxID=220873 RepID=A0ABQ9E1M2_TEGGR|nr:hypothetical protein KUTeg_023423 [Tegillarca granosa]
MTNCGGESPNLLHNYGNIPNDHDHSEKTSMIGGDSDITNTYNNLAKKKATTAVQKAGCYLRMFSRVYIMLINCVQKLIIQNKPITKVTIIHVHLLSR